MVKQIVLTLTGTGLLLLGLIGLLLPFLPGVLLLIGAVACFAGASETVSRRIDADPTLGRWRSQWRSGRGLGPIDRCRLMLWLTLSMLLAPWRRR